MKPHDGQVMSSIAPVEAEYETWIYSGQFSEGLRTANSHRVLGFLGFTWFL